MLQDTWLFQTNQSAFFSIGYNYAKVNVFMTSGPGRLLCTFETYKTTYVQMNLS